LARKFLPSLLALTAVSRIPNACTILAANAERARQARSAGKKEAPRNKGTRGFRRVRRHIGGEVSSFRSPSSLARERQISFVLRERNERAIRSFLAFFISLPFASSFAVVTERVSRECRRGIIESIRFAD